MSVLAEIVSNYDEMLDDLEALRDRVTDPVELAILDQMIVDQRAARDRYHAKAMQRINQ
jgi:hypothetical protein